MIEWNVFYGDARPAVGGEAENIIICDIERTPVCPSLNGVGQFEPGTQKGLNSIVFK